MSQNTRLSQIDGEMSGLNSITRDADHIPGNGSPEASIVVPSIQTFPAELVSEIALHALNHYVANWPVAATLDTTQGPWVFGQICSTWRTAVLSFPRLWSHIAVNDIFLRGLPAAVLENASRKWTSIVQEILRRSGDSSLKLSIVASSDLTGVPSTVMEVLVQQCHRWETAAFYLFPGDITTLNAVRGRLPRLESLDFVIYDTVTVPPPDFSLDIFEDAPALRSLTLFADARKYPLSLPWSQLTTYEAVEFTYGDNYDALRRLDNVVECDLSYQDPDVPPLDMASWGAIPAILTLPHLRMLAVQESMNPDASLLRSLSLPALENLYIQVHEETYFPDMIARSGCSLTTLSLHGYCATSEQVVDALKLMPTLTALNVSETDYNPDFLRDFIANDVYMLPNLVVLKIVMESHILDGELLTNIVQSRRNFVTSDDRTVAALKTFHYSAVTNLQCELEPEYLRRFHDWQREGLDMHVGRRSQEVMVGGSLL